MHLSVSSTTTSTIAIGNATILNTVTTMAMSMTTTESTIKTNNSNNDNTIAAMANT